MAASFVDLSSLPPSKKVPQMTMIAIPLYREGVITPEDVTLVKNLVQIKYGTKSLHPDVIALATGGKKDREGPIANLILQEILLAEHTVGQHYYDLMTISRGYTPAKLAHLTVPTLYTQALSDEIEQCGGVKALNYDALSSLIDDLYSTQDSHNVLGYPALEGDEEKRQSFRDMQEIQSTFQLAPLVRDALGLLTERFALVLVDTDYTYLGHVYTGPELGPAGGYGVLSAMGIRTSMVNLACKNIAGMTEKIFKGVLQWGAPRGFYAVRAVFPFDSAQPALLKAGFVFDKPRFPMLINRDPITDISVKEYGPYFADKLTPLLNTPAFEADTAALVEDLDLTPTAAKDHLRIRLLSDPTTLYVPHERWTNME